MCLLPVPVLCYFVVAGQLWKNVFGPSLCTYHPGVANGVNKLERIYNFNCHPSVSLSNFLFMECHSSRMFENQFFWCKVINVVIQYTEKFYIVLSVVWFCERGFFL